MCVRVCVCVCVSACSVQRPPCFHLEQSLQDIPTLPSLSAQPASTSCSTPLLHCSTAPLLHCCTAAQLHGCAAALLPCCPAALLCSSNAALLHCSALSPFFYSGGYFSTCGGDPSIKIRIKDE